MGSGIMNPMTQTDKKQRNRNLTQADLDAAERLLKIWNARKRGRPGLTQENVAGDLGMTQGAVSQYLNGKIALGPVATLRFAKLLECNPLDIRPDLMDIGVEPGALSAEAIQLAFHWQEYLTPDVQEAVSKFIFSFPEKKKKIA